MAERFTPLAVDSFLRTVIEASDFGILALDASGRIIVWNVWLAERTALPEEQALGKTLSEAVTGVPGTTLDLCAEVLGTGRPRIVSPVLHSVLIPLTHPSQQTGRIYPIYDARDLVSGVVMFINDISSVLEYERFAEEKAAADLLKWEDIFHAIGHPTLILDREYNILFANRTAAGFAGCSLQELTGRKCYEVMHGADTHPSECPLAKIQTTGLPETAEATVEALGGVYHVSCTPLFDHVGNLDKVIHISMDITELRRTEALLRSKNEDLKAFTYTVSHDLKAPLRGIAGYADELDRKHRASLSKRAQFCIAQVLTATRNLDLLIEDLLHYSRLDQETPTITEVNLPALVAATLKDRGGVIDKRGVQIEVALSLTTVRACERTLTQILANLIDNAIKFSRNAQPPRISVKSEEHADTYRLIVGDNGIGFDMKYHDRIFGLFNRLVGQDEFEGTGVGLAIVKKIIDKQGGRVWAESAPGNGATFFFELPRG